MSRLTVFMPGLFAEMFEQSNGNLDAARWPALALLLARGTALPLDGSAIEPILTKLFGTKIESTVPLSVARLTASIDYDREPEAELMRADPVHLRADPNQILLFNNPSIMPSMAEADALLDVLNLGLPEIGLSRGRHPARWYFSRGRSASALTSSPGRVNGRSIASFLPRNASASEFVQWMNEAQMLLHSTPVNLEREARGIPPINSIWIWGNELAHDARNTAPKFVVGDDVLTAGLAREFGLDWCAEMAVDEIIARVRSSGGSGLAVIGSPTGGIDPGDQILSIDDFEQRWCVSLVTALRRFRLRELRLVTDRQSFLLTPWSLFKVWRNRKPTAEDGR